MIRVVKVGGSLLATVGFVERLERWFARQPPAATVMIFGGGGIVDAMCRLDQIKPLDSRRLHWRCVALLDATYDLATQWLAGWDRDDHFDVDLYRRRAAPTQKPLIARVAGFYQADGNSPLPENWDTTTDSIAGWLAARLRASELRLLKSCAVNCDCRPEIEGRPALRQLAERGIIDAAFPDLPELPERVTIERLD